MDKLRTKAELITEIQSLRKEIDNLQERLSQVAAKPILSDGSVDQNDAKFRSMFQNHHSIMLLIEPDSGSIIDANIAASVFYGFPPSVLRTMFISDINLLDEKEIRMERLRASEEKRNYFIFPHKLANGEIRIVEVHSSPIDLSGITLLFSIIHDITDRDRAEQALRKSEIFHNSIYNSLAEHIAVLNSTGIIIAVNDAWKRFAGENGAVELKDNSIGLNYLDICGSASGFDDEADAIEAKSGILAVLNGDRDSFNLEYSCNSPGEVRWFNMHVTPLLLPEGGAVVSHENISLRKQSEAALTKAALKLQKLSEQVPGVVFQFLMRPDGSSCFPYTSEGIRTVYGISPEEVSDDASRVFAVLHPDDFDAIVSSIKQSAQNLTIWSQTYRIKLADGTVRWLLSNAAPQLLEDGSVLWHGSTTDISKQKAIEEALLKSQTLLNATGKMAKIGGWEIDVAAMTITGTESLYFIFEIENDSPTLTFDAFVNMYSAESKPILINALQQVMQRGEPFDLESGIITLKGNIRTVNIVGRPNYLNGKLVSVSGILQDITQTKQAELLRQKNEELLRAKELIEENVVKYRSLFEHSRDGILMMDISGHFLNCNSAFRNMLGYSQSELFGMHFSDITPSKWHQFENTEIFEKQLLVLGFTDIYEKEFIRKNGSVFPVEVTAFKAVNKKNVTLFLWSVVRDLTERKRFETELRLNAEKFKTLYNNTPVMLHSIDNEGKIIQVSDYWLKSLGYERHEVIGRLASDFLTNESKRYATTVVLPEFIKTGFCNNIEYRFVHKNGSVIDVLLSAISEQNPDGSTVQSLAVITDITQRRQTEMFLKESETRYHSLFDNMLDGFAYCEMIFDGNTPLDFIYIEVNLAFESLTGLKNVTGKRVTEVIPQIRDSNPELFDTYGRVALSGKPEVFETYLEALDEWFSVSVYCPKKYFFVAIFDVITNRKRAEEMLRKSEEKFRKLIWDMPVGVLLQDSQAKIILSNPKALELLGLTEEQLLGKSSFDPDWNVIHEDGTPFPGDTHPVPQAISQKRPIREVVMGVYHPLTRDRAWLLVDAEPQLADSGKVTQVVCTFINISERRKAEEALRISEQRFQLTLELTQIGAWDWDLSNDTYYASPSYYTMLGYEPEFGLADRTIWLGRTHPDDRHIVEQRIQEVLSGNGYQYQYEIRILHADRSYRWISVIGHVAQKDQANRPTRLIGVRRDVTEVKNAADSLMKLQKDQQILLDNIPAWVFFKDTQNRFGRVNKTFANLMGTSVEALEGKSLFDLYPVEQAEAFWKDDKEIIASGLPKFNIIEPMQSSGETIWLETDKIPYRNSRGEIVGIIGFSVDITARRIAEENIRKMNEELLQLNATKDKLFSVIAHDLRSPFHGLLGLSQLMTEQSKDFSPADVEKFSLEMHAAVFKLYTLLENLLQWAQFNRGSFSFSPKTFFLQKIVSQSVDSINQSAIQKDISILRDISPALQINADEMMLTSIFRNLLSNAVKFTRRGGKVYIKARITEDNLVEIAVTDTGVGIPPGMIQKLFIIGEKVNSVGTENEPSSGLGLILCKEFVEKHGGKIWVESIQENVTTGVPGRTTFYFTIPCAE